MEKTEICGLKGIGAGTEKYRLIPLENKQQVIIGRHVDCDVVIQSSMISRKHAILKKTDAGWTIMDNRSSNGVTVDGKNLQPLEPYSLRNLSVIQLGVPTKKDKQADFIWIFKTNIKVIITRQHSKVTNQENYRPEKPVDREKEPSTDDQTKTAKRKLRDDEDCQTLKKSRGEMRVPEIPQLMPEPQESTMPNEKVTVAIQVDEEDEQRQEAMKKESLLKEIEQMLRERYQQRLEREKQRFESMIAQKEICHRMLEEELNRARAESRKQEEKAYQIRKSILSDFTDLMEMELQCSICTELFVKATTLNCSHSYCALCIGRWMRVKKVCPSCRAPITSSARSTVLDNYIDRVIEHLSEDIRKRRSQLVQERKEIETKEENARKCSDRASQRGRVSRSQHRHRNGGRSRSNEMRSSPEDQSEEEPQTSRIVTRSQSRRRERRTTEH